MYMSETSKCIKACVSSSVCIFELENGRTVLDDMIDVVTSNCVVI